MQCTDGISILETDIATEISQNHSDENSTEHEDHCTPFCICACCGTIVFVNFDSEEDNNSIDLSSTYEFYYPSNYSFTYNDGVWHPPANS